MLERISKATARVASTMTKKQGLPRLFIVEATLAVALPLSSTSQSPCLPPAALAILLCML
ncbi:MAG: hypothetical protein ACRDIV_18240 [Ktedonobacteraceae bacterium]